MGLKEIYSAAGAKILGASTAAKVIGTVTVASAMIAGGAAGVHAYTNGQDFTPSGASRAMRANQVHFDGDESTIGKQDESEQNKKSESEMYERDANAEEQEKPQTGDSASYLFDSQKQPETGANNTLLDGNGTAAAIAGTTVSDGAASTPPGTVIDIVSDPSKADMVIKPGTAGTVTEPSAGESGGGNAEIPPVPTPYPVPNPDPTPEPTPTPKPNPKPSQPSSGGDSSGGGSTPSAPDTPVTPPGPPTVSDIENSAKEDTSGSSEAPGVGGNDIKEIHYNESDADMSSDSELFIGNRGNNQSGYLYCGQQINPEDIVRSLSIFISTNNSAGASVTYYFTSEDLGTYLRLDSVIINGEEIKEYPFTIPENVQTVEIKMSYRLKQSDEWTPCADEAVKGEVKPCRVLVLADNLTEVGQTIPSDGILNANDSGKQTANLYGYQLNLYGKRYGWNLFMDFNLLPPVDELFTGWTENGEPVPWIYTADSGRHILQPGEFIPVPDGYTVRLTKGYLDDGNGLNMWQTLTAFDESVLTTNEDGETTLEVPEYVQAVALEGQTIAPVATYSAESENHSAVCDDNVTDYIKIPSTVKRIKNDGCGNVLRGYIVDENNENYTAVDGILTDKAETEYISIPATKGTVIVPENIKKVNLPEYYDGEVVIESETLPEINFANMYNGSITVPAGMMDEVVSTYGKDLAPDDKYCTNVIHEAGSERTYDIHKDCLTHTDEDGNTVLDRVISDADIYTIPDYVDVIGSNAFAGSDARAIRVSNAEISFNAESFADSQIYYALCDDSLKDVITEKMNGIEGIAVATSHTSDDGYEYMIQDGRYVLLSAPYNVKEFRGTVTLNGEAKAIDAIGAHAFDKCTSLEYVSLPESVSEIGASAFEDCTSLSGVMIEGTGAFTIKDHAFDGCTSLRFIGSNAMNMTLENNYDIATGSKSSQISGELWCPTGNAGYNSAWLSFPEDTGITYYEVGETNGVKVLYAGDAESGSWLALRAAAMPSASTKQTNAVELSTDTQEIYSSCFADIVVPYTINWQKLTQLTNIDEAAFANSGLCGLVNPVNPEYCLVMGDTAFRSTDISEVDFTEVTLQSSGYSLFLDCKNLTKATYGPALHYLYDDGSVLPANVVNTLSFVGCDNLTELVFTTEEPFGLATYTGGDHFRFRDFDDEVLNDMGIRITVPEGCEEAYLNAWVPRFAGYTDYDDAYWDAYFDIFMQTWEDPLDEDVQALVDYRLRPGENVLRTMLGMELLPEITENPMDSTGGSTEPDIPILLPDPSPTPDTTPDTTPDDPPKLDITISDPSENEIPSLPSEPEPENPAPAPSEEPSVSEPSAQPSTDAPSSEPSAPDTNTENTEPASDSDGAGEGETT